MRIRPEDVEKPFKMKLSSVLNRNFQQTFELEIKETSSSIQGTADKGQPEHSEPANASKTTRGKARNVDADEEEELMTLQDRRRAALVKKGRAQSKRKDANGKVITTKGKNVHNQLTGAQTDELHKFIHLEWEKNPKSGVPFLRGEQKEETVKLSYVKMQKSPILQGRPIKVLNRASEKHVSYLNKKYNESKPYKVGLAWSKVKVLIKAGEVTMEDASGEVALETARLRRLAARRKGHDRASANEVPCAEGDKNASMKSEHGGSKPGKGEKAKGKLPAKQVTAKKVSARGRDSDEVEASSSIHGSESMTDSEDEMPIGLKIPGKGYNSWPWRKLKKEILNKRNGTERTDEKQEADSEAKKRKADEVNDPRHEQDEPKEEGSRAKRKKSSRGGRATQQNAQPGTAPVPSQAGAPPGVLSPIKKEAAGAAGAIAGGKVEMKAPAPKTDTPSESPKPVDAGPSTSSREPRRRKPSQKVVEAEEVRAKKEGNKPGASKQPSAKEVREERQKRAREKQQEEAAEALLHMERNNDANATGKVDIIEPTEAPDTEIKAFHFASKDSDSDPVTVSSSDLKHLEPSEYLNDTVIDFYIKFLQRRHNDDSKHLPTFHFFNSFFFKKLAELMARSSKNLAEIKKWTKKLDIFTKDYLVVPVVQELHWSLTIIVNPGGTGMQLETEDATSNRSSPCILHLNSMEGGHLHVEKLARKYLTEMWLMKHPKEAKGVDASKPLPRFSETSMPYVQVKVPQQDNLHDCGLFTLHYLELFLENPPAVFDLKKKTNRGLYMMKPNWFDPAEASAKRQQIREIICHLAHELASENEAVLETEALRALWQSTM